VINNHRKIEEHKQTAKLVFGIQENLFGGILVLTGYNKITLQALQKIHIRA
jgi:hypothetical protein